MSDEAQGDLPEVSGAAALEAAKALEKTLEGVMAEVAEVHEEIREAKKAVDRIETVLEEAPVGGPWAWELLSPFEQSYLWAKLDRFVQWLHETYLSRTPRFALTACWYKHPNVVGQLTALMVAHTAVYNELAVEASMALVDWHERCLYPTMRRIVENGSLTDCAQGHKETERPKLERESALVERTEPPESAFSAHGDQEGHS